MNAAYVEAINAAERAALDALSAEYNAYATEQGITLHSADEHFNDPALTLRQRCWVRNFSHRWSFTQECFGRLLRDLQLVIA